MAQKIGCLLCFCCGKSKKNGVPNNRVVCVGFVEHKSPEATLTCRIGFCVVRRSALNKTPGINFIATRKSMTNDLAVNVALCLIQTIVVMGLAQVHLRFIVQSNASY
jgi:hypothetical protein